MRIAKVFVNDRLAGQLIEVEFGKKNSFEYFSEYMGDAVSVTMPIKQITI